MAFDVIPVIDLKGGKAVRATGGDRAGYRPLASPLCPDGNPLTAMRGFLALHPFRRAYIADLDAIEGGARQDELLQAIRVAFPQLELWVDAGFADERVLADWLQQGVGRPVLGSESLRDPQLPRGLSSILSLDFRGPHFLGDPALMAEPALWPADVIVMCLHSVGAGDGPDLDQLTRIKAMAQGRRIYAAGGVQGLADLQRLAALGFCGALIASALHNGAITSDDLSALAKRTDQS